MGTSGSSTSSVRRRVATDRFGHGSVTDVPGVLVGHHDRVGDGWRTGTTVVFCPIGATAAVDVRGGGPGTRETEALAPTNLVDRIHAVCLTGGSAYGLSTADGVMSELERRRLGVQVGPDPAHIVPVVPTAVIFDLGRGGRFTRRPGPDFGRRALRSAASDVSGVHPVRGALGAGTGAIAGGLQGGVGSASTTVDLAGVSVTVGALAVVNAAGSPIDPATGLPWTAVPGLRRPSAAERRAIADLVARRRHLPLNTTIGVVATNARLDRSQTLRLAMSAHDGLARAVRPAHGLTDGDTVFGLSTGEPSTHLPAGPSVGRSDHVTVGALDRLCAAAASCFESACVDAVLHAVTVGDVPSYREICPSAFGRTTRT